MEKEAATRFSTLGHPHRLAIFRLLMRRYPDRVPAGELAAALALKPSTLSAYLSSLMQARLVTQTRAGTSLRYAVDMAEVQRTLDYLFFDCCRGRPGICYPGTADADPGPQNQRRQRVLFLCTGNSARSIMAEAILRSEAGDRFEACSAGTEPYTEAHPSALAVLARNGHDIAGLRPKHVSEFQAPGAQRFDVVLTICDRAANEDCPAWAGHPVSAHWGMPDPVTVSGSEADRSLAFERTYLTLRHRIAALAALPIATLDRVALQEAIDQIGQTGAEVPA